MKVRFRGISTIPHLGNDPSLLGHHQDILTITKIILRIFGIAGKNFMFLVYLLSIDGETLGTVKAPVDG
jgi:hypothetical protein